jgi:hypothetical protein
MPASPAPTPVLRLVRTPASTFSLERSFERGQVVLLRSGRKPLERPLDVGFLVPFAAGNFIYIGASDLVPEVNKHHDVRSNVLHFVSFIVGIALLWGIRAALEP